MEKTENGGERPPLFPSWRGWYAAVLLILALQVALFTIFTLVFQ